ncbi:hypothetical protein NsoK4_04070 [Nitrosopumilus sp. K4]|uniref:hypothetical protein n=1 Tax=Nitrosopumilus sp. K4 TaxID=2795383 RepID=UPI001BA9D4DA|nr:hypothetical protein [Nitrosopumilus sp. K4]QUC65759.1 hypothetical protein NsoK4_04070 [Nitrosopumilus sp. K4]
MIEVVYYEISFELKSLSEQIYVETSSGRNFWADATKYAASKNEDEPFVSEIAYVMVTLHRTGA